MKQKKLIKKIQRLEAQLQKRTVKLATLKRKLKAMEAAKFGKAKSKSSARGRKAFPTGARPASIQTVKQRLLAMTAPKPKPTTAGRSLKSVKKKRHITPERRAQLSAAMKARWAAKAAARANPQQNSQEQTPTPEETSPQ